MTPTKRQSKRRRSHKNAWVIKREAGILLMLAIPIVLILLGVAVFYNQANSSKVADEERLIRSDSPTLGPEDAPVTIVEFLDPECESCRAAFPVVKQLLDQYEGQIRLVVRYFPLHNNSVLAAKVTEAAGNQGMYWEMQELLFTRQTEWGEQSSPQTALFLGYAEELGLDVEQLEQDLQNPDYDEKIERDRQDGIALGVNGTPTFFINGRIVDPLSFETMQAMIEEALADQP